MMSRNRSSTHLLTHVLVGAVLLACCGPAWGDATRTRATFAWSLYTAFGRMVDSVPLAGPSLTAATWDPQGDGGAGELRLVFSAALDAATVENPALGEANRDFLPLGWAWAAGDMPAEVLLLEIPSAADRRVIALRGFSAEDPPEVGDAVSLSSLGDFGEQWTGGMIGAGGAPAQDRSQVPITTGPVMVQVTLSAAWHSVPMTEVDLGNLEIYVCFDHDILVPDSGNDTIFDLTPELADATAGLPADPTDFGYAPGASPRELVVTWQGGAHFRYPRPGWSKLWIREGSVAWAAPPGTTNGAHNLLIDNEGPNLLAATYVEATSEIWLAFDEPLDPEYLETVLHQDPQYALGGGAAWGGAQMQSLAFPGSFVGTCRVTDPGFLWNGPQSTIQVDHSLAGADIADYQGRTGPSQAVSDPVPIYNGLMILRVDYERGGAGLADDALYVAFSDRLGNSGALNADDFEFVPAEFNAWWDDPDLVITEIIQGGTHSVAKVTGWDAVEALAGERLPQGLLVKLDDGDCNLTGFLTGLGKTNTQAALPVCEDLVDWPVVPAATEVPEWTGKYYAEGPPVRLEGYLAWHETAEGAIADEWLLFSALDETALTQALINDFAGAATPIRALGPGTCDPGIQRFAVDLSPGTTTTGGSVLEEGDEVWFMLVPATFHGSIGYESTALIFSEPITISPVQAVPEPGGGLPSVRLHVAGPNPVAGSPLAIAYAVPTRQDVTVTIHDASGRRVATLIHAAVSAGSHEVHWGLAGASGRRVESGLYFCRLTCETGSMTRKFVITE